MSKRDEEQELLDYALERWDELWTDWLDEGEGR